MNEEKLYFRLSSTSISLLIIQKSFARKAVAVVFIISFQTLKGSLWNYAHSRQVKSGRRIHLFHYLSIHGELLSHLRELFFKSNNLEKKRESSENICKYGEKSVFK